SLDLPLLDAHERVPQLADLVLSRLLERVAVADVEGRDPLEALPAALVGLDRVGVAAERHLRLAQAVVGDGEQGVELDRLSEVGSRLLAGLLARELLAAAVGLLRVAALLLVERRSAGEGTEG